MTNTLRKLHAGSNVADHRQHLIAAKAEIQSLTLQVELLKEKLAARGCGDRECPYRKDEKEWLASLNQDQEAPL